MSTPISVRVLSADDISAFLGYADCIAAVEAAMMATSRRAVHMPLRQVMPTPGGAGWLGVMPGSMDGEPDHFGVKLLSLFPGNAARGLSSHMGLYVLYEGTSGRPLALLEAGRLTAIRTAAATAVATKYLARPEASRLALIGTGEQAEHHLAALALVRPLTDVAVWGRNPERTAAFIARLERPGGPRLRVAATVEDAVDGADIICTVTAAAEPVLFGRALRPGQHVNLVGASTAEKAEADNDCVLRARVYVDYRESAMAQAGELLNAIRAGVVSADHIQGEIGDVILGTVPGRRSPDEITLYKSLGIAAQDIAAAVAVLAKAEAEAAGAGQLVNF